MADDKRAERRRKRRKGAAAGRPASYSQLYKDDNSIKIDLDDTGDESVAGGKAGGANSGGATSGKGSDSIDWQGEYRYVLRDLRTVLLVSVLIFAVMISVGVFL